MAGKKLKHDADTTDVNLAAWSHWEHPRWPEDTPGGKGGEFMVKGDLIGDLLGESLYKTPDINRKRFVADNATGKVAFYNGAGMGPQERDKLGEQFATNRKDVVHGLLVGVEPKTGFPKTLLVDSANPPSAKAIGGLKAAHPKMGSSRYIEADNLNNGNATKMSEAVFLDSLDSEKPIDSVDGMKLKNKPAKSGLSYVVIAEDRIGFIASKDLKNSDTDKLINDTPGAKNGGIYNADTKKMYLNDSPAIYQKELIAEAVPDLEEVALLDNFEEEGGTPEPEAPKPSSNSGELLSYEAVPNKSTLKEANNVIGDNAQLKAGFNPYAGSVYYSPTYGGFASSPSAALTEANVNSLKNTGYVIEHKGGGLSPPYLVVDSNSGQASADPPAKMLEVFAKYGYGPDTSIFYNDGAERSLDGYLSDAGISYSSLDTPQVKVTGPVNNNAGYSPGTPTDAPDTGNEGFEPVASGIAVQDTPVQGQPQYVVANSTGVFGFVPLNAPGSIHQTSPNDVEAEFPGAALAWYDDTTDKISFYETQSPDAETIAHMLKALPDALYVSIPGEGLKQREDFLNADGNVPGDQGFVTKASLVRQTEFPTTGGNKYVGVDKNGNVAYYDLDDEYGNAVLADDIRLAYGEKVGVLTKSKKGSLVTFFNDDSSLTESEVGGVYSSIPNGGKIKLGNDAPELNQQEYIDSDSTSDDFLDLLSDGGPEPDVDPLTGLPVSSIGPLSFVTKSGSNWFVAENNGVGIAGFKQKLSPGNNVSLEKMQDNFGEVGTIGSLSPNAQNIILYGPNGDLPESGAVDSAFKAFPDAHVYLDGYGEFMTKDEWDASKESSSFGKPDYLLSEFYENQDAADSLQYKYGMSPEVLEPGLTDDQNMAIYLKSDTDGPGGFVSFKNGGPVLSQANEEGMVGIWANTPGGGGGKHLALFPNDNVSDKTNADDMNKMYQALAAAGFDEDTKVGGPGETYLQKQTLGEKLTDISGGSDSDEFMESLNDQVVVKLNTEFGYAGSGLTPGIDPEPEDYKAYYLEPGTGGASGFATYDSEHLGKAKAANSGGVIATWTVNGNEKYLTVFNSEFLSDSENAEERKKLYQGLLDAGVPPDTYIGEAGQGSTTLAQQVAATQDGGPGEPAWADDLSAYTYVSSLGGSTGASLVKDSDGNQFVSKQGSNPNHLREEYAANEMYKAAGINVPEQKLYNNSTTPVRLSKYEQGKTLGSLTGAEKKKALDEVRKGFAADALFANWDVIGMSQDNILVRDDGSVLRIDNGGSLRYRAQGAQKTHNQFGDTVGELDTMRDPNKGNGKVFSALTDEQVAAQIFGLDDKRDEILEATPLPLQQQMNKRMDNMLAWAKSKGFEKEQPDVGEIEFDEGLELLGYEDYDMPAGSTTGMFIAAGDASMTVDDLDSVPDTGGMVKGYQNLMSGDLQVFGSNIHAESSAAALHEMTSNPETAKLFINGNYVSTVQEFYDSNMEKDEHSLDPNPDAGYPPDTFALNTNNQNLYTQPHSTDKSKVVFGPDGTAYFWSGGPKSHHNMLTSLHDSSLNGKDYAKTRMRGNYDPSTNTLQLWRSQGDNKPTDAELEQIKEQMPYLDSIKWGKNKDAETIELPEPQPLPDVYDGPGHPPDSSYGKIGKGKHADVETFSLPSKDEKNGVIVDENGNVHYWTPLTPEQSASKIASYLLGGYPKPAKAWKGTYDPSNGQYTFSGLPSDYDSAVTQNELSQLFENSNGDGAYLKIGKQTFNLAPTVGKVQTKKVNTPQGATSITVDKSAPIPDGKLVKPGGDPGFPSDSYVGVLGGKGNNSGLALYNKPRANGKSNVIILNDKSTYFYPEDGPPSDQVYAEIPASAAGGVYDPETGVLTTWGAPPSGTKRNFKKVVPEAKLFNSTELKPIPEGASAPNMPPTPPGGNPFAYFNGHEVFTVPQGGYSKNQKVVLSPSGDNLFWTGKTKPDKMPRSDDSAYGIYEPKTYSATVEGPPIEDIDAYREYLHSKFPQLQTLIYNGQVIEVWEPGQWSPNPAFDNLDLYAKDTTLMNEYGPKYNALNKLEKSAVQGYQSYSGDFNQPLRHGYDPSPSQAKRNQNLDSALAKQATSQDMIMHRGIGCNWFQGIWMDHQKDPDKMIGYQWTDYGYLGSTVRDIKGTSWFTNSKVPKSTATKPDFKQFQCFQKIRIPKGTPAMYAKASGGYGGEYEFLLAREITWRVLGAWIDEHGAFWVETELVGIEPDKGKNKAPQGGVK